MADRFAPQPQPQPTPAPAPAPIGPSGAVGLDTDPPGTGRSRPTPAVAALGRLAVRVVVGLVAPVVVGVLAAGRAHAQDTVVVLALAASVEEVLNNVRNWVVGILASLATVYLTVGGARLVMAGGDPGEVERARAAFRSAAFGYALAALAPLVVEVLKGIVGA